MKVRIIKTFVIMVFFALSSTLTIENTSTAQPINDNGDMIQNILTGNDREKNDMKFNEEDDYDTEGEQQENLYDPRDENIPLEDKNRDESTNNFISKDTENNIPEDATVERKIGITGAILMNYVFDNSPNSFTVKYRIEMSGKTFLDTATIKGDVKIEAKVEGPLWAFPTGECDLNITVPSTPFEMVFRKINDDKANIKLIMKKTILETWESKCNFTDSPDASFNTFGPPEKWLQKALSKARPPFRSIMVNLKDEKTSTPVVIAKQTLGDPPLGSIEMEGSLFVTVEPQ